MSCCGRLGRLFPFLLSSAHWRCQSRADNHYLQNNCSTGLQHVMTDFDGNKRHKQEQSHATDNVLKHKARNVWHFEHGSCLPQINSEQYIACSWWAKQLMYWSMLDQLRCSHKCFNRSNSSAELKHALGGSPQQSSHMIAMLRLDDGARLC